jgi:hypothetical protein
MDIFLIFDPDMGVGVDLRLGQVQSPSAFAQVATADKKSKVQRVEVRSQGKGGKNCRAYRIVPAGTAWYRLVPDKFFSAQKVGWSVGFWFFRTGTGDANEEEDDGKCNCNA